jgi:hypothetical protein
MLLLRLCAALAAVIALVVQRVSAQTLAADPPAIAASSHVALRAAYHVRLESAWPAPAGETDACNNRASETLAGMLQRVGPDRYEGRFLRRTRLGFCGTHGPAVVRCGAVLRGTGEVAAVGRIVREGGRATMTLLWQPIPETTRVTLEGSCAPRFTSALEAMYRGGVHSVDFALPVASPDTVVLDDYGRTLEIR